MTCRCEENEANPAGHIGLKMSLCWKNEDILLYKDLKVPFAMKKACLLSVDPRVRCGCKIYEFTSKGKVMRDLHRVYVEEN